MCVAPTARSPKIRTNLAASLSHRTYRRSIEFKGGLWHPTQRTRRHMRNSAQTHWSQLSSGSQKHWASKSRRPTDLPQAHRAPSITTSSVSQQRTQKIPLTRPERTRHRRQPPSPLKANNKSVMNWSIFHRCHARTQAHTLAYSRAHTIDNNFRPSLSGTLDPCCGRTRRDPVGQASERERQVRQVLLAQRGGAR